MLTNLLYLSLLIIGFLVGLLLAKLCKEELDNWRKRLFIMSVISLIGIITMIFVDFLYKIPIIVSLFFIIIVCLTINWKGY
tara:strand:- start:594 stop:836 length:243 start_codon:yes stop_codon:yes gene_type:complete